MRRIAFRDVHAFRTSFYLTHPWIYVREIWLEVTSFIQRGLYGYSVADTWWFSAYLSTIIAGGVRHLRHSRMVSPAPLTHEQWDQILDTIADGFDAVLKQDRLSYDKDRTEYDRLEAIHQEGLKLFGEWYRHLWD